MPGMNGASRWRDGITRWRRTWKQRRRVLERRVALDSWHPHVPIALATAAGGLLQIAGAARAALGVGPTSVRIAELEGMANAIHFTPTVEAALGFSLIAIALGLALRSQLAWFWAVTLAMGGLSIRVFTGLLDSPSTVYVAALLLALLVFRRHFRSHSLPRSSIFALTIIVTFLMWATLGVLRLGYHFDPPILDLMSAFYFSEVTVSTVGYGDIVAADRDARIFVVALIVVGIFVSATAVSSILLPLIGGRLRQALGGRGLMERSDHYVIVGKSPLARNTTTELENRKQRVTLVLDRTPEEDFYKQRDVVIGDPTDISVLRTAGTESALGVLALSTDDAENGFVILGVNEINPEIRTVVALNDPRNESRLKRTQPSLLLSLQALGSELLAMALTGERVDMTMLSRVLQLPGAEPKTTA